MASKYNVSLLQYVHDIIQYLFIIYCNTYMMQYIYDITAFLIMDEADD